MPILGLIDAATFSNAVGVTTGSATVTKNAADAIDAGDIIELSGVRYYVKSVDSTTQITLGSNYAAATNAALAGAVRRTAPKALADYIVGGGDSAAGDVQIIGVSRAEAQLATNKARGISSPGWWAYRTYTDAAGTTRHKAECIASFKDGSAVSGDASDDAAAADVLVTISITQQPTQNANPVSIADGATSTVAMTAIATPPGDASVLTFQWQKLSGDKWSNVAGQTSATLSFSPYAAADAGEYRCKINSTNGGAEVISNVLTVETA